VGLLNILWHIGPKQVSSLLVLAITIKSTASDGYSLVSNRVAGSMGVANYGAPGTVLEIEAGTIETLNQRISVDVKPADQGRTIDD
jgi:hypothetical protein